MNRTAFYFLFFTLSFNNLLKSQKLCATNIEIINLNSSTFASSILGKSIFFKDKNESNTLTKALNNLKNCKFEQTKIEGNFESIFAGKYNTWTYWKVKNLENKPLKIILQADFDGDSLWYFTNKTKHSLKVSSNWEGFSMYRKCTVTLEAKGQYQFMLKQHNKLHMGSTSFPQISAFDGFENKYLEKNNFVIYGYFFQLSFLLAILIFVLVHYFNFTEKDTLFYSFYLLSVIILVWRNFEGVNPYFTFTLPYLPWFKTKLIITAATFIFYILFVSSFIEKSKKWVFKSIKIIIYIFILFFVFDLFAMNFMPKLSYFLYFLSRQVILVYGLITLILVFNSSEYLSKYIFIGSIILMITDLVTVFIKSPISSVIPSIGVLVEAVIFTIVLGKRSYFYYAKNLKNELQILKLERENELKTSKIKTQIAHDLHDDLGISLSSLKFITYKLKNENKQKNISESLQNLETSLENISTGISEIIWSMDPEKDNVSEFIFDIKKMAESILNKHNISFEFLSNKIENNDQLNGAKRRAISLCIKEALHNAIKHSNAELLKLNIDVNQKIFKVKIADNGRGFQMNPHAAEFLHGNGLKNMEKRMREIGGSFKIYNDRGTIVELESPLYLD